MICLDANFLIGGVIDAPPESQHLLAWAAAGEIFGKAAPAISQQAPLATLNAANFINGVINATRALGLTR